ncbi:MAG: DUF4492 domain-containing protein [Bacteroidales bacterium]|nr:DUF4492 domain-containing protein [Bacteroidales bacterium]
MMKLLRNIWGFYYDGFRGMTIGRRLWAIILIKLFIMFFVLRLFFFPNFLNSRFDSDQQKGDFVGRELIDRTH